VRCSSYLFLQQKIKSDERLTWFALADIERGETTDGKIAYIKALVDDFADDKSALAAELMTLPDSFSGGYLVDREKYGITLPIDPERPVLAGVLGKEKPLDLNLSAKQLAILLGLAAHLRGFEFATIAKNIVLYPFGWVEVKGHPALKSDLINLAGLLKNTDLIIENHRDSLFRLSINPEIACFDESLFSFTVKQVDLNGIQTKIPVTIHRDFFATAFGKVENKNEEFKLTLEFMYKLKSLDARQLSTENEEAVKIEDAYKKGLHKDPKFLALGLRSLVRRESGMFRFCCKLKIL